MLFDIIASNLGAFVNIDLFSVGLAVAATAILGFLVFFNNTKSITNRSFLLFSIITALWSLVNYFQYQAHQLAVSFWLIRFVVFFGVWHAYSFLQLCLVFPKGQQKFPNTFKWGVIPVVCITSILTLTPLIFSHIDQVSPEGKIISVANGPMVALLGIVILLFVISGVYLLAKKVIISSGIEKKQIQFVLLGAFMTFLLLMTFNFILPAYFENPQFIPFGAVFLLPFIGFTFYAIAKHHLLNTKIISVEILTFVLTIATFFETIFTQDIIMLVLRSAIFLLILSFSILLIRSVRKEVEQREQLQKLTDDLKEANGKLEDLSRFKTQLLSLASHQIKSPLAAIKGFAQILMEGLYGPVPEKVKETLDKMKQSADGLVGLINTLLDVRKVEEGKMDYQFARVDMAKLVTDKVEELRQLAVQKKLSLEFTPPSSPVWVNADAQKLLQVIQNLVDNAIKYTPAGSVNVALEVQGDSALLSVKDTGLGIPAELLPHLFEEFIREERVKTQILGTGLGLFIARKIVEAHSGRIWSESEGKDKGAKFFVALKRVL